jgi:hypothetical protein
MELARHWALLVGAALLTAAQQPSTAPRLAAEMEAARSGLTANAPDDQRASPLARLDRAKRALDAGQIYLAAYLTESPWEGAKNFTLVKTSAGITTSDAFLKKWTAMGEPKPTAPPNGKSLPAFVEAIAAVAEARGPITYHASRPYADDGGLFGGLYYLADSHSVMQFAAMVRALDWPSAGQRPSLRSITGEINAFDMEMTTAYEKMEKANHPTYIQASAALKQARTLNDRGQFAGALFEYLLSRYLFAPLRGPAPGAPAAERVNAVRGELPSGIDHSIAEMFLQLAEEQLALGGDSRRNASSVLDEVIPAYRVAIAPTTAAATAAVTTQVTITLVRWPFT